MAQLHAAATDAWTSLTDGNGRPLNVRPHWAKQWEELTFNGVSAVEYLKTKAYREVIPEFRKRLAAAAAAGGCTLADLKARFSNPMMDDLFEEVFRT